MTRNVRSLCLVGLIVGALYLTHPAEPPSSPDADAPLPRAKTRSPEKRPIGPRGAVGGIFLMVGQPAAIFRVWFPKSCERHEGAIDAIFGARKRYPEKVAIMGVFGVASQRDEEVARSMKWAGKPDLITINGQEEFELPGPKGTRRVRFQGFEGKDYSLHDLRSVIDQLIK